jgi:hypothetical protein
MFWPPNIPILAAEAQATLSAWDGCVWRLAAYGMTHPSFVLWVYSTGRPTSLHVICYSPSYYCGPTGGNGCRFAVLAHDAEPMGFVLLRDEAAKLEIRCHNVQISEVAPPHWIRTVPEPDPPQDGPTRPAT